jgi:Na+/H+ antiporter NhaD/arsenite permease-like protein
VSLLFGPQVVRDDNNFDYLAIVEVAALFVGIFVAMQPALEILNARGSTLGIDTPAEFFWASGTLSSVLDNAPTYLVFFKTAQTLPTGEAATVAGVAEPLLMAISLGAVLMGAMTYIGNGPNFMVKTIAEKSGVQMPSFFGYVVYSVVILLPILVLNTLLFVD